MLLFLWLWTLHDFSRPFLIENLLSIGVLGERTLLNAAGQPSMAFKRIRSREPLNPHRKRIHGLVVDSLAADPSLRVRSCRSNCGETYSARAGRWTREKGRRHRKTRSRRIDPAPLPPPPSYFSYRWKRSSKKNESSIRQSMRMATAVMNVRYGPRIPLQWFR